MSYQLRFTHNREVTTMTFVIMFASLIAFIGAQVGIIAYVQAHDQAWQDHQKAFEGKS